MIGASFDSTKTPLQELLVREPELFRAGVAVEPYDEGSEEQWDTEDPIEEVAS
jgi:hypothetical protein